MKTPEEEAEWALYVLLYNIHSDEEDGMVWTVPKDGMDLDYDRQIKVCVDSKYVVAKDGFEDSTEVIEIKMTLAGLFKLFILGKKYKK
jgi:hypothetical protein